MVEGEIVDKCVAENFSDKQQRKLSVRSMPLWGQVGGGRGAEILIPPVPPQMRAPFAWGRIPNKAFRALRPDREAKAPQALAIGYMPRRGSYLF